MGEFGQGFLAGSVFPCQRAPVEAYGGWGRLEDKAVIRGQYSKRRHGVHRKVRHQLGIRKCFLAIG